MVMIILAIVASIFGIAFLCWGIYQIKTGKMVAKHRDYAVDEPREVGVLFTYLGILGIALGLNFLFQGLDELGVFTNKATNLPKIFTNIAMTVGLCGPVLLILSGIYNLTKKRVYGIKTTAKTKPKIKKYYRTIGLAQIIAGLTIPTGILLTFIPEVSIHTAYILFAIGMIAVATLCTLMTSIESRQKSQKRQKKQTKSKSKRKTTQ